MDTADAQMVRVDQPVQHGCADSGKVAELATRGNKGDVGAGSTVGVSLSCELPHAGEYNRGLCQKNAGGQVRVEAP